MIETKPMILAQLQRLRGARPKVFWAGMATALCGVFGMVTAFATAPHGDELQVTQEWVEQSLGRPPLQKAMDAIGPFVREERIYASDTFGTLARRLGINDAEAYEFILTNAVAQQIFEELRPGKVVTAHTDVNGRLISLSFPLNDQVTAIVVEGQGKQYSARKQVVQPQVRTVMKSGLITSSFFGAADNVDLPDAVSMRMADIFGGAVDFHRGLRRGDRFSVVFEEAMVNGRAVRAGRVLAAEFVNDGLSHRAIWFGDGSAEGSYYTPDGRSLKTAFLRSPIEFSRVTSGFSMRFHPILHTWRAHRGVDYGAPIGTPVRATADGTVMEIGRQNGYGNLIALQHSGPYSTYYGHLDGFAHGLKRGMRVSQGQIIGYVGRTGWATGPHLHYEFRINDVQQDPLKVAVAFNRVLSTQQLAAFRQQVADLSGKLDRLRELNLAQLD